ncbi:MAG: imidazole glycerol phosphate synthase subunit HisF [Planctomycetota bacterium]|jgi:imidazoleglycerol phosphate synthase cyclase subunit
MLTRRIIPCLDIDNGRVVKGTMFANLRDVGDPVDQASQYEQDGADEIVLLDVSATSQDRLASRRTIERIRSAISIPITVGGGVRSVVDVLSLLASGADKVSLNTAAVENPTLLSSLSSEVGTQCVVLALDAAAHPGTQPCWDVVTHSGKHKPGLDAVRWATRAQQLGAGEILLTSWDRDGTQSGYDLDLIRAIDTAVTIPIIASGGASSPTDMHLALDAGADAVLAASIFHDNMMTIRHVKNSLAALNVEVRP